MMKCPVCSKENDDFATTCIRCSSFLQNRIPNLDFFETAWKILESPQKTFRRIVVAEHKNYSFFLFALFGISLSFSAFWYFRLGNRFDTLLDLIPWAVLVGVCFGVATALVLTALYHGVAKLLGGNSSLRNSFAILAYSLVPIVGSLVLVLPIELLTFGMYLFTSNPHPYTIKPLSYVLLMGFDGAVAAWSILLVTIGTIVGHQLSLVRSIVTVSVTLALFGGVFFLAAGALQVGG